MLETQMAYRVSMNVRIAHSIEPTFLSVIFIYLIVIFFRVDYRHHRKLLKMQSFSNISF